MDFSDADRNTDELVIQGVTTHMPDGMCEQSIMEALEAWSGREATKGPFSQAFEMDKTLVFSISYDGVADHYFPDKRHNWLSESLVRGALFKDGVCTLEDETPLVYSVRYGVQAIFGTEHLLICPYLTEAKNIGGIVVTCVNHYLRSELKAEL